MIKIVKHIVIIYAILFLGFVFTYIFMGQPLPVYLSWGIASIVALVYTLNFLGNFKLKLFSFLIYIHPVLLLVFFQQYDRYPYKQTIVLPDGYEGLVVIEYNRKDGESKEYTGGFLGIGSSWLIKVDANGYAKTQHKFSKRSIIPGFIRLKAMPRYFDDAKIYYNNDMKTLIPKSDAQLSWYDWEVEHNTYSSMSDKNSEYNIFVNNIIKNKPVVFYNYEYVDYLNIFIVTKPNNYKKYFEPDSAHNYNPKFNFQFQQKIDSIYATHQY